MSRRTNEVQTRSGRIGRVFARRQKLVISSIMILAKALTGRYLAVTITLCTEQVFSAIFQPRLEDDVCITPFQLRKAVQAIESLIAEALWQGKDCLEW